MIKIKVYKNRLNVSQRELLTAGNVNSLFTEFVFSSEWDGLSKIAVFENGENRIYMGIDNGSCVIPWEVLQSCGKLRLSLRGVNNSGNEVLCTEDADLGFVHDSLASKTSSESHEPTEDKFAELENMILAISDESHNQGSEVLVYESAFKIGISCTDNAYAADKTFEEIESAYNADKFIYADFGGSFFYLDTFLDNTRFSFSRTFIDNDTVEQISFRIDSDDSVTRTDNEYENAMFVEVEAENDDYSVEADTYENVVFACSNNRPVFAKLYEYVLPLIGVDSAEAIFAATASSINGSNVNTLLLRIASDDSVSATQTEIRQLPDYSESDNGKVLGIANGIPSWRSIGAVSTVNGQTGTVTVNTLNINDPERSMTLSAVLSHLYSTDSAQANAISGLRLKDADLETRVTIIETGDTPVNIYVYWESVVGAGRISLSRNGLAMSVSEFISAFTSGAKIIVAEINDTDSRSSGYGNSRYKISGSTSASFAFDVGDSWNGTDRTIIISDVQGYMVGYQDIAQDELSDYAPLPVGSSPASQSYVDDAADEVKSVLQTQLGTLNELETDNKSSIVEAVNEVLSIIPAVPANVSAFTNDRGYLTLATLPVYTGGVE